MHSKRTMINKKRRENHNKNKKKNKNKNKNKKKKSSLHTVNTLKQLLLKAGWVKVEIFEFAGKAHSVVIARKSLI